MKDPYAILGLPKGAPMAEVRRAYRQRVKETHPDLNGTRNTEAFQDVQWAYRHLRKYFVGRRPSAPNTETRSARSASKRSYHTPPKRPQQSPPPSRATIARLLKEKARILDGVQGFDVFRHQPGAARVLLSLIGLVLAILAWITALAAFLRANSQLSVRGSYFLAHLVLLPAWTLIFPLLRALIGWDSVWVTHLGVHIRNRKSFVSIPFSQIENLLMDYDPWRRGAFRSAYHLVILARNGSVLRLRGAFSETELRAIIDDIIHRRLGAK